MILAASCRVCIYHLIHGPCSNLPTFDKMQHRIRTESDLSRASIFFEIVQVFRNLVFEDVNVLIPR